MSMENIKSKNLDAPKPVVARTPADIQRLKLEKLMKNPDKLVIIPEKPKERGAPVVPDFVRNVMGSSAGAGSGEFHVYRHLRRKEYARQHYMSEKARWEKLEDEYHDKIVENKRKAEKETAKKRAKRLKKKQSAKKKGKGGTKAKSPTPSSSESEEEEEEEEEAARSPAEPMDTRMDCDNKITRPTDAEKDEGSNATAESAESKCRQEDSNMCVESVQKEVENTSKQMLNESVEAARAGDSAIPAESTETYANNENRKGEDSNTCVESVQNETKKGNQNTIGSSKEVLNEPGEATKAGDSTILAESSETDVNNENRKGITPSRDEDLNESAEAKTAKVEDSNTMETNTNKNVITSRDDSVVAEISRTDDSNVPSESAETKTGKEHRKGSETAISKNCEGEGDSASPPAKSIETRIESENTNEVIKHN